MHDGRASYDPAFVARLFDHMSRSYELLNTLTSIGFSVRWRRQMVKAAGLRPGAVVADFMTGRGECWRPIRRAVGDAGRVVAIDFSEGMLRHARRRARRPAYASVEVRAEDVLASSLPDGTFDAIVAAYGLKTMDAPAIAALGRQVHRLLRAGGTFAFVEVSVPPNRVLRGLYLAYLRWAIPVLGFLLAGNSRDYRYLGRYTRAFGDAQAATRLFRQAGLEAEFRSYFFGCATGVVGRKPAA